MHLRCSPNLTTSPIFICADVIWSLSAVRFGEFNYDTEIAFLNFILESDSVSGTHLQTNMIYL